MGTGFPRRQEQGKECSAARCGEDCRRCSNHRTKSKTTGDDRKVQFGVKLAGVLEKGQALQDAPKLNVGLESEK